MTVAILDTTVIVHLLRKYKPALTWFNTNQIYSITTVTWMEVMVGVPNKRAQADTLNLLNSFELLYVTQSDQDWAMQQIERLRFSNSVSMNDAMIAAVVYRLQVLLYSHNLKDMAPMIGALAVKPYS
ncbi:MAG: PIN domain-containing protein [Anaerolineae bacterium]|nr:PIN domain-containing protein [Anaerolineae bacterium]